MSGLRGYLYSRFMMIIVAELIGCLVHGIYGYLILAKSING